MTRANGTDLRLAKGLGYFSIGLGMAEIAAPTWLGRTTGIGAHPLLLRALGAREIASGVQILREKNPGRPLWTRVLGDLMDLTLLGTAFSHSARRTRVLAAIAVVLGVFVLDTRLAERFEPA